jgi:hypothetical protein
LVITICFSNFTPLLINSTPSLINCFTDFYNSSEYRYVFNNDTSNAFHVCNKYENCRPVLRICSENENPQDTLLAYITPAWLSMIVLSFLSTFYLHFFGYHIQIYLY